MDNKLNFSKIIEKNIKKFNMNPNSFLSKFKPKNYSIDFIFKDFKKNSKLKNSLLMSKKISNTLYVELKKQINEKKFNFDRFKRILSNFFKDKVFISIIHLVFFTILYIFFKINFNIFEVQKLFTIIIFLLFYLKGYIATELFMEEYKKSNTVREAIINIKKYYDDLKKTDLSFFQLLQALKFVLIFIIFIVFIFLKYLSSVDLFGFNLLVVMLFFIKVLSFLIFLFNYKLLVELKSAQEKKYKYGVENNLTITTEKSPSSVGGRLISDY